MIQIVVKRGLGDKEASTIQDDRIVHEQMAIRRGANFINESWYLIDRRNLRVPHRIGVRDAKIANITEGKIPISGKHYLKTIRINGTPDGIIDEIEVESYREFF